ncbi:MAG: PSD1 and planctomycete cytochrome C domain-containing protein [Planctomycetota bacterium]
MSRSFLHLSFGLLTAFISASIAQAQTDEGSKEPLTAPNQSASDWEEFSKGEKIFALEVAPTLDSKCAACHGRNPDEIESGFVITTREQTIRGGDSGEAALVPEKPDESWIYKSSTWEHDELQMPPKENDRLNEEQLAALKKWIGLGAPWPDEKKIEAIRKKFSTGITVATSGGLDSTWDDRRYAPKTLWAYQPLKFGLPAPTYLPASSKVDLFVNAKLAVLEIAPAARASRHDLIRRLYLDLTGLPPTPEAVARFVSNPASDQLAWEQLVDQVLSSPHFGEQAATHWLDVVRYADSAGFSNDYQRPNAWRYRDYVARCFNEDRPLDQFIREQIAGDEIDENNPELLIATGMLRMGPWEHTGMSVAKVTRQQFLDDITDLVGQAFLAHPLQCARCHDHKFDPIPTRDYYRIQAVFATTQFADRQAAFLDSENQNNFKEQSDYLKERIGVFSEVKKEVGKRARKYAEKWYADRGLEYASRSEKLKNGISEDEIAPKNAGYTPRDFGEDRIATKYVARHNWELDRYKPMAFSVYSGPDATRRAFNSRIAMPGSRKGKSAQTSILGGGDVFSPTIAVTPGTLSVLAGVVGLDARETNSLTESTGGRRHDFAKWLTDAKRNPLTPRVMANRIWQQHFGQGLVKTANNFGTASEPPSHPELLDYLASELVRTDWSSKNLHREILLSEAYCRTSRDVDPTELQAITEKDPLGSSYAVFRSRRLSAEQIRDSILAISGLLNHEVGGVPVRPNINPEVGAQPRQIMGSYAPIYQASPLPKDRNRRALYALQLRTLPDPMLEVFNKPSSDLSCELRDNSTVAPQGLTLFNSPFSYERALAFADRVLSETTDKAETDHQAKYTPATIHRIFQLAFGREADSSELAVCLNHWEEMTNRHESIQLATYRPPTAQKRSLVSENTGESFEFTEPLEQNRDYIPDSDPALSSPRARGLAEVCLVILSSNELLYAP